MEFDDRVQSLHDSFLASECLNSDCDINTAFILLHDFINQLSVYQAQYEDLMELQELLQSAVVNFSLLKLLVKFYISVGFDFFTMYMYMHVGLRNN